MFEFIVAVLNLIGAVATAVVTWGVIVWFIATRSRR